MSGIARNQGVIVRHLLAALRPHVARDSRLPARIQRLLTAGRRFGARDRRLYRELLYTAVRYWPWLEAQRERGTDPLPALAWLAADCPFTEDFKEAHAAGWPALPATVAERGAVLGVEEPPLPSWFRPECPPAFVPPDLDALLRRAPLWLRWQTADRAAVLAEFSDRGWRWQETPVLASALRLEIDVPVTDTQAYRRGQVEVQDLGSQCVLAAVGVEPGTRWLDACAGAGGKTLQLAHDLGAAGAVTAFDIRSAALDELQRRAARAGLVNIRLAPPSGPEGSFDGVLVDAPCSGSGTWRRSPHLKWCLRPGDLAVFAERQAALLARFSRHVRPGGRLIYATCSLAQQENGAVLAAFLARHPEFSPAPWAATFGFAPVEGGLSIRPARHDTDGFFVASLRRR